MQRDDCTVAELPFYEGNPKGPWITEQEVVSQDFVTTGGSGQSARGSGSRHTCANSLNDKPAMEVIQGLGSLSILPREIRDQIWSRLTPCCYKEHVEPPRPYDETKPSLRRKPTTSPFTCAYACQYAQQTSNPQPATCAKTTWHAPFTSIVLASSHVHYELTANFYGTSSLIFYVQPHFEGNPLYRCDTPTAAAFACPTHQEGVPTCREPGEEDLDHVAAAPVQAYEAHPHQDVSDGLGS